MSLVLRMNFIACWIGRVFVSLDASGIASSLSESTSSRSRTCAAGAGAEDSEEQSKKGRSRRGRTRHFETQMRLRLVRTREIPSARSSAAPKLDGRICQAYRNKRFTADRHSHWRAVWRRAPHWETRSL